MTTLDPAPATAPAEPTLVVLPAVASIEDKLVRLEARGRRGTLIKEPPAGGLAALQNEDLEQYSLEALKKLAKLEHLDISKNSNRDAVLQALSAALAAC